MTAVSLEALSVGAIVEGPIRPEPVEVIATMPMGSSVKLIGKEARFWNLADSLSKLYPVSAAEMRWVDGVLARKKGLGF